MKKVLFIDRDGTIIYEPADWQIDSLEKLEFLPGVITALSRIACETDFELVMVTNQDGLGTNSFPEATFWPVQNKMLSILKGEGVIFSEIFVDRSLPEENSPSRKPGTAMLTRYLAQGVDLVSSFVIGDRESDIKLAENLGCRAICLSDKKNDRAVLTTTDWDEIFRLLKSIPRTSSLTRETKETRIRAELNLDGSGKCSIKTGIGFFNHMLEQFAKHSGTDLFLDAEGDIDVDEHHLIEDVGIVLGTAFSSALGSKRGIERYGFTLPMDDALAQVAIDFGGRPWLVWDVDYKSECIGSMPTEMVFHFFKSFSDNAKCNLNIKAEGQNEHHKTEALFKAFARAVKMAAAKSGGSDLPTTKGII
jgi:imidazoleglycerol-phosphate dehydratase/histidinol-phosphatase